MYLEIRKSVLLDRLLLVYCYCNRMGCSTSNYLLLLYQNGMQHLKLFIVTVSKWDAAPQTQWQPVHNFTTPAHVSIYYHQ